ncbi:DndE family protein [Salegentibacter sp. LM13S]|uniref:DndE family protein n=1 Tax=Salegentibacter lacus TaxID=2873599 RepID=UPI001CCA4A19|nr:DndE family protein [Salegentibacter lacus]MBZ9631395.1 DndE family protein [Salegentibacter lacus]
MFSHIRTSKENKEVVTRLTNKLNLGTENIIARIALTYSLSLGEQMDLTKMKDSGGKSYSKAVLFGEYIDYYIGLTAVHYNVHASHSDLPKFIKMHIDVGLNLLINELEASGVDGFDFLAGKIEQGVSIK